MSLCFPQSQHHDNEKRALSREIIVLNNHLMEAKLTIEKLREDNVRALYEVRSIGHQKYSHNPQCIVATLVYNT